MEESTNKESPDGHPSRTEREKPTIRALNAQEYAALLQGSNYRLRISDGTPEGTYHFWTDSTGTLQWRNINWTAPKPAEMMELEMILEDGGTTQLLIEEEA